MRTQVEFRSAKFAPYEGEEEQVNPGLWGRRLAEYLSEKLRAADIQIGESHAEDWGWRIPLPHDAFSMWLGCGHCEEHPDGYLVFIEPSKPVIRRWFKKIDTTKDVARVADALDQILASDPDVRAMRWRGTAEK